MCYACNPSCGRCRPKRVISVECPQCGAPHSLSREEFLLLFDLPHKKSILERKMIERDGVQAPACGVCGASLAEAFRQAVEPRECKRSRIVCGYPCGRCDEVAEEGTAPEAPCAFMVPLRRLDD